jgi:tetratricopeptide (TPR) repeat protein
MSADAPVPSPVRPKWLPALVVAVVLGGALAAAALYFLGGARLVDEARIAMRAGTSVKDREAIALIERAVAIAPDDAAAWGLMALVRARADQHAAPDAAVSATALIDEAAQRALALDPGNAGIWFAEGSLALRDGRPAEAVGLLEEGLKRDPRNASAYFDLGNAHILQGQTGQALKAFERAARLRRDFWEAINNQALVLYEQGDPAQAIEHWRRVLDIKPDAAEPNLALAAALFPRGGASREEALQRASKALTTDPNYVLESYQEEQLWGPRLRRSTQLLLLQPRPLFSCYCCW